MVDFLMITTHAVNINIWGLRTIKLVLNSPWGPNTDSNGFSLKEFLVENVTLTFRPI
jgi:hypothetical protein